MTVLITASETDKGRYFIFRNNGLEIDFYIVDGHIRTKHWLSEIEKKVIKEEIINESARKKYC